MPETVSPAPPAYEDIVLPSAPPDSSPSIPTGPPPDFSTNDGENALNSTSAAPHLPPFPRIHSFRSGNDNETQPPPYQFVKLSVTQLDETAEAHRLELERETLGMRRQREWRERQLAIESSRRVCVRHESRQPDGFWTGVFAGSAINATSSSNCHHHTGSTSNSDSAGVVLCIGCVLCGVIGSCALGCFLCSRGCRNGRERENDHLYRILCILAGIFFIFILPAGAITGVILFFQNNPNFFDHIDLSSA